MIGDEPMILPRHGHTKTCRCVTGLSVTVFFDDRMDEKVLILRQNLGITAMRGKNLCFSRGRFYKKRINYKGRVMKNGQTCLTSKTLLAILLLSIAVAAIPWITMRNIDARLTENPPNNGIVAFELAGNAGNAQGIADGWGPELSILARKSITVDFVFIPGYTFLFFSITMFVSLLLAGAPRAWTRRAAFLPFVSGLADIVENSFLLLILRSPHDISGLHPRIAAWCATVKFGLLALVVVVWIIVALAWLIKRGVKKTRGAAL